MDEFLILRFSSAVDCKFNCHKRCAAKVPRDCLGEVDFNGGKFITVHTQHTCTPAVLKCGVYI